MLRFIVLVASLATTLAIGCVATIFANRHPFVSVAGTGGESADVKSSFRVCRLYASWPVELKSGESLTLERRVCPVGFHKSDDDEGWVSPVQHEVLLLEKRSWWKVQIVSAHFSDLEFTQVAIGKTAEGRDAVLWSYYIKCGSCHGGPIGVLAWSKKQNIYNWNENWYESISKDVSAKLPADTYADSPPTLIWENSNTQLAYSNSVYGPSDAHCCPSAGTIAADMTVKDGAVTLGSNILYLQGR